MEIIKYVNVSAGYKYKRPGIEYQLEFERVKTRFGVVAEEEQQQQRLLFYGDVMIKIMMMWRGGLMNRSLLAGWMTDWI